MGPDPTSSCYEGRLFRSQTKMYAAEECDGDYLCAESILVVLLVSFAKSQPPYYDDQLHQFLSERFVLRTGGNEGIEIILENCN